MASASTEVTTADQQPRKITLSTLEALPAEVLDIIGELLIRTDLAHLTFSGETLFYKLEPTLEKIARWTIDDVLLCAVKKSSRIGIYYAHCKYYGGHITPEMLYTAFKRGDLETFKLLIKLGADSDIPDWTPRSIANLLKNLSPNKKRQSEYLRAFLDAGFEDFAGRREQMSMHEVAIIPSTRYTVYEKQERCKGKETWCMCNDCLSPNLRMGKSVLMVLV